MAKSSNQKLKLLYIMRFLLNKSDEEHPVSIADIIAELSRYGISAERKSLYDDIEALTVYGLDIVQKKENLNCLSLNFWWTACSPQNSSRRKRRFH